ACFWPVPSRLVSLGSARSETSLGMTPSVDPGFKKGCFLSFIIFLLQEAEQFVWQIGPDGVQLSTRSTPSNAPAHRRHDADPQTNDAKSGKHWRTTSNYHGGAVGARVDSLKEITGR